MKIDFEKANEFINSLDLGVGGISVDEEVSDGAHNLEDSIIIANRLSDGGLALAIMSQGASYKGIPIKTILVPDLSYYSLRSESLGINAQILRDKKFERPDFDTDYNLGFNYFYTLLGSKLVPFFSSEPVWTDMLFESLGNDVRHSCKDKIVIAYTSSKSLTSMLLRESGIPVAKSNLIQKKDLTNLDKIIERLHSRVDSTSLVFKADNGACGKQVMMARPDEKKKITEFIDRHIKSTNIIAEERMKPLGFRINGQKFDSNMRVFGILTDKCEYVGGVVRAQPWSKEPVNLSKSARGINLDEYAKKLGFSLEDLFHFTIKAGQPFADIRKEYFPIVLGFDFIVTEEGFKVIEVNSGSSGGFYSLGMNSNFVQPRIKLIYERLAKEGYENFKKRKIKTYSFLRRKESCELRHLRAVNLFKKGYYKASEISLKSIPDLIPTKFKYKKLTCHELKGWIGVEYFKIGLDSIARDYLHEAIQFENNPEFALTFTSSTEKLEDILNGFETFFNEVSHHEKYEVASNVHFNALLEADKKNEALLFLEKVADKGGITSTMVNLLLVEGEIDLADRYMGKLKGKDKYFQKLFYLIETLNYKSALTLLDTGEHFSERKKELFSFIISQNENFKIEKVLTREEEGLTSSNEYDILLLIKAKYLSGYKTMAMNLFRNLTEQNEYMPFIIRKCVDFYNEQNDEKSKQLYLNFCSKNDLPRTKRLVSELR